MNMAELWHRLTNADIRNTIAVVWVIACFGMLALLSYHQVPAENKDLVHAAVETIKLQLTVIISFYFVQSKSEVDKSKTDNPTQP
jgi:hypothetical protein